MAVYIERFNSDTNTWDGLTECGRFKDQAQAKGVIDMLQKCGETAELRVSPVPRGRPKGSSSGVSVSAQLGYSKRRYTTLMRNIEKLTAEADELYNFLAEHDAVPTLDSDNVSDDVPSVPSLADDEDDSDVNGEAVNQ